MVMTMAIKSRHSCEEECSPALEIVNAILAKSTRTPTPDVVEDLPHAITGLSSKNVIRQSAGSENSDASHSSSESAADSDSDSESGSSSASSSSTTSSSSLTLGSKQKDDRQNRKGTLARPIPSHEGKMEDEGKHLRSKNEIDPDKITVPSIKITVNARDEIVPVGKIVSSMESVVVVSTANWHPNEDARPSREMSSVKSPISTDLNSVSALDHGSALCFEDRRLLGLVDETFGPVECPFYVVRFNTVEERDAIGAEHGRMVYVVKEQSSWVRGSDVLSKGYDTSNWDDEECNVPDEYSDDEEERAAKQAQRRARVQKRENGKDNANELKRRRLNTSYPKCESSNTVEIYNKSVFSGAQHRRSRPRQGMIPNLTRRSESHDLLRCGGGRTCGPIRNTPQFGNHWHSASVAPNMPSSEAVASSEFYAQARPTLPHNMRTQRGYAEGPLIGPACPSPNGPGQQVYHHQGLSGVVPTVYNAYQQSMGTALPGVNVGVPHYHNGIYGRYGNNGEDSAQPHYNQVPAPHWYGNAPPQMRPRANAVELNQSGMLYGGPGENERSMFYRGPTGHQHTYERTTGQIQPPGVNQYPAVGFSTYAAENVTSRQANPGASLDPHHQQTVSFPPPRGR